MTAYVTKQYHKFVCTCCPSKEAGEGGPSLASWAACDGARRSAFQWEFFITAEATAVVWTHVEFCEWNLAAVASQSVLCCSCNIFGREYPFLYALPPSEIRRLSIVASDICERSSGFARQKMCVGFVLLPSFSLHLVISLRIFSLLLLSPPPAVPLAFSSSFPLAFMFLCSVSSLLCLGIFSVGGRVLCLRTEPVKVDVSSSLVWNTVMVQGNLRGIKEIMYCCCCCMFNWGQTSIKAKTEPLACNINQANLIRSCWVID